VLQSHVENTTTAKRVPLRDGDERANVSMIKNQHFNPKLYLRRWANEREQIWYFDKVTRESRLSNIKNVASSSYFYDFDPEVQKIIKDKLATVPDSQLPAGAKAQMLGPQVVEHDLNKMETGFAKELDGLLAAIDTQGCITGEQQARMSYYLAKQLIRGPEFRQQHIEAAEKVANPLMQQLVAAKFGPDQVDSVRLEFNSRFASWGHFNLLYDSEFIGNIAKILFFHVWRIGVAPKGTLLYTSDNPITRHSHLGEPFHGIGSRGIEIMFPLSPRHMLFMWDRTYFPQLASRHLTAWTLEVEKVAFCNSYQVLQNFRQVYSLVSDFERAVNLCAEYPQICDPDRKRITILRRTQTQARRRE